MLLRRLLGIVCLSFVMVIPVTADEKADKAKTVADAKAAVTKAETDAKTAKEASDKAVKAAKEAAEALDKKKDDAALKTADEKAKKDVADTKAALEKADKAVTDAKAVLAKAEDAAKDKVPEKKEKATLEWKFEKGKEFYQKMTTKTKQTMTVQTNKVEQNQEQTFYFKWTIVDKVGDSWIIKQKIEGVAMNIDIGNQKIAYDSTKEKDATANNPLADFFKALKDSEFTLTLDPKTMKVTKIEGHTAFIANLGKQNPQMKPLLETILSEKALMQMAEPTFAAIPGGEKTVGDKWERDTALDMGPIGKYENKYTYTFESRTGTDKKIDTIKVETSLKYTPPEDKAAGTGTGGLPFKIKSADLKSTKAEGSILFSEADGRIEKSTMKLKLSGKLSIEIGGQVTEVELDQDQDSEVLNSATTLMEVKK